MPTRDLDHWFMGDLDHISGSHRLSGVGDSKGKEKILSWIFVNCEIPKEEGVGTQSFKEGHIECIILRASTI
jgi:hypothetical protein